MMPTVERTGFTVARVEVAVDEAAEPVGVLLHGRIREIVSI